MIAIKYAKLILILSFTILQSSTVYANAILNKNKETNFFQFRISSESGRKTPYHLCFNEWKNVPMKFRHSRFSTFKKYFQCKMVSNIIRDIL